MQSQRVGERVGGATVAVYIEEPQPLLREGKRQWPVARTRHDGWLVLCRGHRHGVGQIGQAWVREDVGQAHGHAQLLPHARSQLHGQQ